MSYDYREFVNNPNLLSDYKSFMEGNKNKLPKSARALFESSQFNSNSDASPYDSDLDSFEMDEVGSESSRLVLNLSKNWNNRRQRVIYKGVYSVKMELDHSLVSNKPTWRYSIFLPYDEHRSCGLKGKMFKHQIEWIGEQYWTIIAREVEHEPEST